MSTALYGERERRGQRFTGNRETIRSTMEDIHYHPAHQSGHEHQGPSTMSQYETFCT